MKLWRRIIVGTLALGVIMAALPLVLVAVGNMLYGNRSYDDAQKVWQIAKIISFYDRDAVLLDIGDAQYRAKDLPAAAKTFEEAASIASDARYCSIIYNWGRSLADQAASIEATDKAGALSLYADALRVIAVQRCTTDPDYRDQFETLRKELLKKIAELTKRPDKPQSQQQSNGDDAAQKLIDDHTAETLEQRKYQNARDADQIFNNPGGSSGKFVR